MKYDNTLVLAHYYTIPEVQAMADFVGDSLELAQKAQAEKPKRIVFAGVKFMAETAKLLNPEAEVILPDIGSTCSLVEQTNIFKLKKWRELYSDHYHVAYINSSVMHKATADIIVTSRIVEDVMEYIYATGRKVCFSPDRNMGRYLSMRFDRYIPLWDAVCDVHDQFDPVIIKNEMCMAGKIPHLIAHIESPLAVSDMAEYVGSTYGMINWIKNFLKFPPEFTPVDSVGMSQHVIYVATEAGVLYNMKQARPDLDIRPAPVNKNCRCSECPFMKMNKKQNVTDAITKGAGFRIDYISQEIGERALVPINRMMEFSKTGEIRL